MCPVARASEIFAERWTPLILREILAGRQHFNEIQQGLHRISPSVLGARLRALERAGVVERAPNPSGRGSTYRLTESGDAIGIRGQTAWISLRKSGKLAVIDLAKRSVVTYLDVAPAARSINPANCAGCAVHGVTVRP
jgi:DNA-binding HxlR family transcriptional regulator